MLIPSIPCSISLGSAVLCGVGFGSPGGLGELSGSQEALRANNLDKKTGQATGKVFCFHSFKVFLISTCQSGFLRLIHSHCLCLPQQL